MEAWQRRGCPWIWRDTETDVTGASVYDLRDQGSAPRLRWHELIHNSWDWDVRSFDTGFEATSTEPALRLVPRHEQAYPLTTASLLGHLEAALDVALSAERPAILLSGGVDSSLIAVVAKSMGIRLTAYHVGPGTSEDALAARALAGDLSMPLQIFESSDDELARAMTTCTRLLGHPSPEFPLAAAALTLLRRIAGKHDVIVNGEPADALLGGIRGFHAKMAPEELSQQRRDAAYFLSPLSLFVQHRLAVVAGARAVFPFYSAQFVADSLATPWHVLNGLPEEAPKLGGEGFKKLLQRTADTLGNPLLSRIARRPKIGLPATMGSVIQGLLAEHPRWHQKEIMTALTCVAFEHTLASDEDVPFGDFMRTALERLEEHA